MAIGIIDKKPGDSVWNQREQLGLYPDWERLRVLARVCPRLM